MAVVPKSALSPAPSPSIALGTADLPALRLVPKPVHLDFAANPNRYPTNRNAGKAKPPKSVRVDLSPRLELVLNVQCDAGQEEDPEMEW